MCAGYADLHVHLAWATLRRLPLITSEREDRLYRCLLAVCEEMGAEAVAVGGMPDHVHLLVRIPPTTAVSELVKRLKGRSARMLGAEEQAAGSFRWMKSYGAFAVSRWDVARVSAYIRRQKEHHGAQRLSEKLERMG